MVVYSKVSLEKLGVHSIKRGHGGLRSSTQPQGKSISISWEHIAIEKIQNDMKRNIWRYNFGEKEAAFASCLGI